MWRLGNITEWGNKKMDYMWHKTSEQEPEKDGKYIVCDNYGRLSIKEWRQEIYSASGIELKSGFVRADGVHAKTAFYWTELPEVPDELKHNAEIAMIEQRIDELERLLRKKRTEIAKKENS